GVARVHGSPVRSEFARAATTPPPVSGRHVLSLGGSQGSRFLNERVPEGLALLRSRGQECTVTHQTGRNDVEAVRARYLGLGLTAEVVPFIDDMVAAMAKASVIVGRAGASTLAEATVMGRPMVLVPLPGLAD